MASSGGECLGHFDYNDTGPGARRAKVTTPYKERLEELGFEYLYGDEGLEDGRHKGEDLWHMVRIWYMVFSVKKQAPTHACTHAHTRTHAHMQACTHSAR